MATERQLGSALPEIPVCVECHLDVDVRRYVHYLRFPDVKSLRDHIVHVYGKEYDERWGTSAAATSWWFTMRQLYGNRVDANGFLISVWEAWGRAHGMQFRE